MGDASLAWALPGTEPWEQTPKNDATGAAVATH